MESEIDIGSDRIIVHTGGMQTCFRNMEEAAKMIAILHQRILKLHGEVDDLEELATLLENQ